MGVMRFVIARTALRRPTLQHLLADEDTTRTVCGLSVIYWSRAYQAAPIPQIMCLRCNHHLTR